MGVVFIFSPRQADSVVGRPRNHGKAGDRIEDDQRSSFCREYLRIIAEHWLADGDSQKKSTPAHRTVKQWLPASTRKTTCAEDDNYTVQQVE